MRLLFTAGLFNNKSRLLIVAKENQKNAVFRWTVPHWRKVFNYPNCFVALLLNELKASMKDVETAGFMADPAARLILR